ncbi:MAG: CBS domain-containing protein [Burkholderiaceae bacterium]
MSELALKTFRFPENTCIPQAQPASKGQVTLSSPGRLVMTDLVQIKASTIAPDTTLERAEQVMIHQGVRLLFVVSNFPCVDGLVTATDLSGDKPIRMVTQRNIRFEDLCVSDVMSELSMIDAIDYDDLKISTVNKVIATFKKFGRKHLLVVQGATLHASARIRGVISLTQLERQLGQSIATTEIASTFAEIEQALA